MPKPTINEAYDSYVLGLTIESATMNELAADFIAGTELPREYVAAALLAMVKQDMRRAIHRAVSSDGLPLLISLPDVDRSTGEPCRRYKQVALFNRDDYLKAWHLYDQAERTARDHKHAIERHHDARRFDDQPLRKLARQLTLLTGPDDGENGATCKSAQMA